MTPAPPTRSITYSDIVPLTIQDELILIRDTTTAACFRMGDIRNRLIKRYKGRYTQAEIEGAIAYYAGKSARSIRSYGETAGKIPEKLRQEFAMLAFGHFAYAARFDPKDRPQILAWAADNSASVDLTANHFGDRKGSLPPNRVEFKNVPELFSGFTLHVWRWADKNLPLDKHQALRQALRQLADLLKG